MRHGQLLGCPAGRRCFIVESGKGATESARSQESLDLDHPGDEWTEALQSPERAGNRETRCDEVRCLLELEG